MIRMIMNVLCVGKYQEGGTQAVVKIIGEFGSTDRTGSGRVGKHRKVGCRW